MVKPVYGYDVDVPSEAIGYTIESEQTVYDEEEWDKLLGVGFDRENQETGDSEWLVQKPNIQFCSVKRMMRN